MRANRKEPQETQPHEVRTGDPVADLILSGQASTVGAAEELYLDTHIEEVLRLVDSPLSDEEFRSHPLIQLLLARGSPPLEDSLR